MCGSMIDIQSATAEIRRGIKKDRRRKKPQDKNIMSASATQGGHNKQAETVSDYGMIMVMMIGASVKAPVWNYKRVPLQ